MNRVSNILLIMTLILLPLFARCEGEDELLGQRPLPYLAGAMQFTPGRWASYIIHEKTTDRYYCMKVAILEKITEEQITLVRLEYQITNADDVEVLVRILVEEGAASPGKQREIISQIKKNLPLITPMRFFKDNGGQAGDIRALKAGKRETAKSFELQGNKLTVIPAAGSDDNGKALRLLLCDAVPPLGLLAVQGDDIEMYLQAWGDGSESQITGKPREHTQWIIDQTLRFFTHGTGKPSANTLATLLADYSKYVTEQRTLTAPLFAPVTAPPTTQVTTDGISFNLEQPSSSALLVREYPTKNLRIMLLVNYRKPGTIFDTVGINAAPTGAFTLSLAADSKLTFQIYDPIRASTLKAANGWHLLTSTTKLLPNTPGVVNIEHNGGEITLAVNGVIEGRLKLATPLSGDPIYIGDFPGDDHWRTDYRIHPAMIGTVSLLQFGEIDKVIPPVEIPVIPPVEPPVNNKPAILQPVATDTPEDINAGVEKIAAAFRTGDLKLISPLISPVRREQYLAIFTEHQPQLQKIANLLATRKLLASTGAHAEYSVTDNGESFSIYFERINNVWCLAGL